MTTESFDVFTDGACSNNGKKNAYAGIGIHFPNEELDDISLPFQKTPITNQRAELFAILTALETIQKGDILQSYGKTIIYTDSKYSIDCLTKWIKGWISRGWVGSNGQAVKNKDLISAIYKIINKNKGKIQFKHVRSHTKKTDYASVGNRTADTLATEGAGMNKNINKNVDKTIKEKKSKITVKNKVVAKNKTMKKTISITMTIETEPYVPKRKPAK